jgi:hypothetical protein
VPLEILPQAFITKYGLFEFARMAFGLCNSPATANLRAVLVRFREYGLKLKPKKCELFQKEVEFCQPLVGAISNSDEQMISFICDN